MIGYIIQSFTYNFLILWILFILSPCYIILASGMGKIYVYLFQYLHLKGTYIYKYIGDISWMMPFKVKNHHKFGFINKNSCCLYSLKPILKLYMSF